MNALILMCILAVLTITSARPKLSMSKYDPFWDDENTHCGSELADELEAICDGKYNELPPGVSQSIVHRRKMGVPLITEECCYSPCSRRTLKTYCAPGHN